MNRDGQVWLDGNDRPGVYVVLEGPCRDGELIFYKMLELYDGEVCEWGRDPTWEEDNLLTRVL